MSELYEYLYALVLVGLVSGVLFALSPGRGGGVSRYIKYALSLAVVVAVLLPVVRATGFASSLDGEELEAAAESLREEYVARAEQARGMIVGESAEAAGSAVRAALCARFGLKEEAVAVSLSLSDDGESLLVRRVDVTLGIAAFGADADALAAYVRELCGCECGVSFT